MTLIQFSIETLEVHFLRFLLFAMIELKLLITPKLISKNIGKNVMFKDSSE